VALRTALYDAHAALGATFTEFGGFDMPVHYGSIKDEHAAVRSDVGLFDVSHMSNLFVSGSQAEATLAAVTPSDPTKVADGRCKYTVILRNDGTILDDTIYSRVGKDRFLVIPNAGMNEAAVTHLRTHGKAKVEDVSRSWSILALQGPKAEAVYEAVIGHAMPKPFTIEPLEASGVHGYVSGTGYTGERGVEFILPDGGARALWDRLLAKGEPFGIRPCGLGARDTLRLEKGYCLAGNEFAGGRTPVEAGLGWLIDWKSSALGMEALRAQKVSGDHDRLVGLRQEKGIPRHGYGVHRDGERIGEVTSGTQSPSMGVGIALAYVRGAGVGDGVEVDVRGRMVPATVVKPPFL
jgi:aminomethyltransferase